MNPHCKDSTFAAKVWHEQEVKYRVYAFLPLVLGHVHCKDRSREFGMDVLQY